MVSTGTRLVLSFPVTQRRVACSLTVLALSLLASVVRAQTVTSLMPDTSDSPLPPYQAVTWTAVTDGGSGPLTYQFWRCDASTGWSLVQDYSPSPSYSWTPVGADSGDHALQVWVRNAGATATVRHVGRYRILHGWRDSDAGSADRGDRRRGLDAHLDGPRQRFRAEERGLLALRPERLDARAALRHIHDLHVDDDTWGCGSARDPGLGQGAYVHRTLRRLDGDRRLLRRRLGADRRQSANGAVRSSGGSGDSPHIRRRPRAAACNRSNSSSGASTQTPVGRRCRSYAVPPRPTRGGHRVSGTSLQVWVRHVGSSAPYEAWSGAGLFNLSCAALTLTAEDNFYRSNRPPPRPACRPAARSRGPRSWIRPSASRLTCAAVPASRSSSSSGERRSVSRIGRSCRTSGGRTRSTGCRAARTRDYTSFRRARGASDTGP